MADLINEFNVIMGENVKIEGIITLSELKPFFETTNEQTESLQNRTATYLSKLQAEQEELKSNMGLREKFLGGRLGGDKNKSRDSKEIVLEIESISGLLLNIDTFYDSFNNEVMEQAVNIIAADDEDFSQTVEYYAMMTEAVEFSNEVIDEINEALEALDEAEDAEELDMYTDSSWLDMESDEANAEAADEVQDVNNILHSYREFLTQIGEAAEGLDGSDFDFTWGDMMNEDFFGDFWGGGDMLNKISQGQNQMTDLHDKIKQLFDSFAESLGVADKEIEARLEKEWEAV